MDLSYGPRYLALREEVRDFIKQYGDQSPRTGGGRKRPDKRATNKLGRQISVAETRILDTDGAMLSSGRGTYVG